MPRPEPTWTEVPEFIELIKQVIEADQGRIERINPLWLAACATDALPPAREHRPYELFGVTPPESCVNVVRP